MIQKIVKKVFFQVILILIGSLFCFGFQPGGDIVGTRTQIAEINIALYQNRCPSAHQLSALKTSLDQLTTVDVERFPASVQSSKNLQTKLDNLSVLFAVFHSLAESRTQIDSLKDIFRMVDNNFNSVFGEYFYEELLKSKKQRILIFSTSMSCECTLAMCNKQETEIQILEKEHPGKFDYAVIDAFSNVDVKKKYNVEFIPTMLIINSADREVERLVREENLYEKLSSILGLNYE